MQQEKSLVVIDEPTRELTRPAELIRPLASIDMLDAHRKEMKSIVGKLRQEIDYGVIPGTGGKASLLKPGAEVLCFAYGLAPRLSVIEKEIDHNRLVDWKKRNGQSGQSMGLYRYVVRCELVSRMSGDVVGSGIGSCSSTEAKYCDRPRDSENTILKMAKKRAFVDATLTTFAISDRFTQDVEDDEEMRERQKAARAEAQQPTPQPTRQPTQSATVELKNGLGRLWRLAQSVGMDEERFKYLRREIGLTQDPLSHTAQAMAELEGRILDWSKAPGDDEPNGDAKPDAVFDRLTRG